MRNGPQVGKMATSPLPYWGSPPLQSGGQDQKWPTSGQNGYLTPAVSGVPTASERGAKSEVAHKWAKWLPHPCRIGDPHHFRAGGKIRSGPQVGKMATSPLPYRGSPPLQTGGAKSEVAHKWAKWLPHPCRIGDPHRFRAGGKIRSGPQVGKVATSPLPYRGSPPLQSGGQNQKWPTSGQNGYLTPAVLGIPTASERGGKIRNGPQVGKMATSPLPYWGSPPLQSVGAKSEMAHKWAKWLPQPCRIGDPHRFRAGGKTRSGPQVGKMATSPLPYRGSPPLQSGGQNQKWPTTGQSGYLTPTVSGIPTASERGAKPEVAHKWAKWLPHPCRIGDPHRFRAGGQNQKWPTTGQSGYLTPTVSGIPTASERGAKSEVAHKWAKWLPHPCRIGDPHRFRAGGKIRSGPQVGKMATSPLPYWGSPPLQSGGQNQKWPTSGQNGYLTPAVSGIPTASERGAESEVAHKWAKWLPHPCRIGDPHRFRAGGQNHKWPTSGQNGYLTPAVSGIPTASERGAKSEVAHKWAKWLPHPCRIGDPHRFRAGGQNQKWPTSGQNGYLTPAVLGIPTASERGAKSEMAHKWAKWLPHPCRIGDPHRFRAGGQNQKWPTSGQNGYLTPAVSGIPTASEHGGKMRNGPQVGKMATSPLPYWGSPPLQSGGQDQKWPTSGQNGYLTPAVSGVPTASERGAKSEVAHNWAKWLPHPYRIGDPHRFRAGGKIRSGPQVGKMATSPLPYWGSPPLQSGGAK